MNIENFIKEFEVSISGVEPGTLRPETNFRGLRFWDSLAALNTLAIFDSCFGKQISGQQLAACQTLQDIYNLAQAK